MNRTANINGVFGKIPEAAVLLTQEQVESLPVGVRVGVLWCGGNGPHEYVIQRDKHGTFVRSPHELQQFALNPNVLANIRRHDKDPFNRIEPVRDQRYNRVWVITDRAPAREGG